VSHLQAISILERPRPTYQPSQPRSPRLLTEVPQQPREQELGWPTRNQKHAVTQPRDNQIWPAETVKIRRRNKQREDEKRKLAAREHRALRKRIHKRSCGDGRPGHPALARLAPARPKGMQFTSPPPAPQRGQSPSASDPPRLKTFPVAVTFCPAKGMSLLFCSVEGVSRKSASKISPAGVRITSGDPPLAQAVAHSELDRLLSPFVNAHAESST